MRHISVVFFLSAFLVLLVVGCDNSSDQTVKDGQYDNNEEIKISKQVRPGYDEKISNLIESLRTNDKKQRDSAAKELLIISRETAETENLVGRELINKARVLCKKQDNDLQIDEMRDIDFLQLQSISQLLAELQNIESLDTLIDCSNRSRIFNGDKSSDYATIPAIVKFKDKAIPALKNKFNDSPVKIKCNIATILTLINNQEAESVLKTALKSESNETVTECLTDALKSFRNNE